MFVKGRMFNCIAISPMIILQTSSKMERIMRLPINKGMMRWERKWSGV